MKKHAKAIFAAALAAAMAFGSVPAWADAGTTTQKTVYKSLDANTEIYRVTSTPGSDYPNFNAKNEPKGGVYYGRTARGGQTGSGYGLANLGEMANESIVSFYYSLDDGYSLEYWSYIYGKALADDSRALLINLNFPGEASDCAAVANGSYDSKLSSAFSYLGKLSCPVFVRIGGEMNVWENRVAPESFQAAYRRIADIGRRNAPNAALVFSPNFSGAVGVDMDSFYPGDSYVDWVGTSLYYNQYANNGDTKNAAFYGVGQYGDPMLNVQQTINLAKLHNKPVMLTEGGSAYTQNGKDASGFAAERVQKAYSFLPMVYPQIKAMVYSDTDFGSSSMRYQLSGNGGVGSAYQKTTQANPVLLHSTSGTPQYYTKASAGPSVWSGMVTLAAYTYAPEKLSATWYVDGKAVATAQDYPYAYQLNADGLAPGAHKLEVKFSNGAGKAYTIQAGGTTATPTKDALYADGVKQALAIYRIDGNNYFNVRDIAAVLNGTEKQFEVGYDAATKSVTLTSGQAYTPTGKELAPTGTAGVQATRSTNGVLANGTAVDLVGYKINGNNYYKLRDLAEALDFYVGYDKVTKSIEISGKRGFEG